MYGNVKYVKNFGMGWVKNCAPQKPLGQAGGMILLLGNPGTEADLCLC